MIGILGGVARFANGHPRLVIAVLAGLALALIGLAVCGAVWLIFYPTAGKLLLFAAMSLAVFVRLH